MESHLTTDALPSSNNNYHLNEKILNGAIDEKILQMIDKTLENYEKISIIFLMYETNYPLDEIFKSLDSSDFNGILCKFITKNPDWKEKFLESICVIGLKNIIVDLGLPIDELEILYSSNVTSLVSKINGGIKVLYRLFESLDNQQNKLLQKLIYKNIDKRNNNNHLDDILEYHAFHWLQIKYISIFPDGSCDFSKIHKHLKEIGLIDTPIYQDMEKYSKPLVAHDTEKPETLEVQKVPSGQKKKQTIENAYVVIINEVHFPHNSEYETRFGSRVDVTSLRQTFSGMNYTVVEHEDKTEKEIDDIMDELPVIVHSKHDCIIVCLLSHGFKGGVVSRDGKEIKIEKIEKKMCREEFEKKLKILIIQACQGENTGRATSEIKNESRIAPDGSNTRENRNGVEYVIKYTEFFKFSSTIDDFVSMRDKNLGSWFIKAVCEILKSAKEKKISIEKWSRQVNECVQTKRGKLPYKNFYAAQVCQSVNRLKNKYYFPLYRPHN